MTRARDNADILNGGQTILPVDEYGLRIEYDIENYVNIGSSNNKAVIAVAIDASDASEYAFSATKNGAGLSGLYYQGDSSSSRPGIIGRDPNNIVTWHLYGTLGSYGRLALNSNAGQWLLAASVSGVTNSYRMGTAEGNWFGEFNPTTGAYVALSTSAVKTNISPLTGSVAVIKSLNPVSYQLTSTGETDTGFVAEEVKLILPEAVSTDDAGAVFGMHERPIVAHLVKAVQELLARVEMLEAQLK